MLKRVARKIRTEIKKLLDTSLFPQTIIVPLFVLIKHDSTVVNLTLLCNDLKGVIPSPISIGITPAGIQFRKTGFPRIKYGAGSIRSGMTKRVK